MLLNDIAGLAQFNKTNATDFTNTHIPALYVRYFNPKIKRGEQFQLKYYVSDYDQTECIDLELGATFTTTVTIDGKTFQKTTYAGEQCIDLGMFKEAGETYFSIQTVQNNGVASIKQFFDIWVLPDNYEITDTETYTMLESDLTTYGITPGEDATSSQIMANSTAFTNLYAAVKEAGYRKIVLLNNIYMLDYHATTMVFPSDFTVDMNGATFKAAQSLDKQGGKLVYIKNCHDTHVINGNAVGNYTGFDFAGQTGYSGIKGEGLSVLDIDGGSYNSFENMITTDSVGYNCGVFMGGNTWLSDCSFSTQGYIDNTNTLQSTTENIYTTNYYDITSLLTCPFFMVSYYLGYGGFRGIPILFMHFYDADKNYIESYKTYQYQNCKIPKGAKFLRITGFGNQSDINCMALYNVLNPYNCAFIGVHSKHTRTCAMHPGMYNHLLIKDCTFEQVAWESGDYSVTVLALDFEDGYEQGKNLYFINNKFISGGSNNLAYQRGFNCNCYKNTGFNLDFRGGIKGCNCVSNIWSSAVMTFSTHQNQSHIIFRNDLYLGNVTLSPDYRTSYSSFLYKDCVFKTNVTATNNCGVHYHNCAKAKYPINKVLTNCTLSNTATTVNYDAQYTTTVSAKSGYTLGTVKVMMGKRDITADVYSDGTITIPHVIDDIQIEASNLIIACTGLTLSENSLSFNSAYPQTITATYTPSDTSYRPVWTSSDETIATVSDGTVVPIAQGTCTVTATCGNQTANCTINVTTAIEPIPITTQAIVDSLNAIAMFGSVAVRDSDTQYHMASYGNQYYPGWEDQFTNAHKNDVIQLTPNKTYTIKFTLADNAAIPNNEFSMIIVDKDATHAYNVIQLGNKQGKVITFTTTSTGKVIIAVTVSGTITISDLSIT